jgi:RND family efflux transporter MFP subunit
MASLLRKSWFWSTFLLTIGLVAVLWLWAQARQAREMADPNEARRSGRPIPVRTVQVDLKKVEDVIGGTATTVATDKAVIQVNLGSTNTNPPTLVVKAVQVHDGSIVKRDDLLFEIEDSQFRLTLKQWQAALVAAQSDLARARAAVDEKLALRKASLVHADAELKKAQAMAAEKPAFRKTMLALAEAGLQRARAMAAEKSALRKATLTHAQVDLEKARAALAEKPALRKAALAHAEAELRRVKILAAERGKVRKLTLALEEETVKFHTKDLEIKRQHLQDAEPLYKKLQNDLKGTEVYFKALSDSEKAVSELAKARRDLEQAKQEAKVGPFVEAEAIAKAETELQQAQRAMVLGPLSDQEAVAKAEKELQEAKQLNKVGPLVDQDAIAKAENELQQAKQANALGPVSDEEAVARAEKDLQEAKQIAALAPLSDQEALDKAAAALEIARLRLAVAQKDLADCQVKAPLDGIVENFTPVPGAVVKVHVALAQILNMQPAILVKMDFPMERVGEVALGREAEVVLDSFPGETFAGKVVRIGAQLDTKLRVLPVFIEVANRELRLRPGITGFVRLRSTRVALVVPTTAVIAREGKAMVFRVEQGRARARDVRTGPLVDTGLLEVQEGLSRGDEVVIYSNFYRDTGALVQGNGFLHDNDRVDVNWRKWARHDD